MAEEGGVLGLGLAQLSEVRDLGDDCRGGERERERHRQGFQLLLTSTKAPWRPSSTLSLKKYSRQFQIFQGGNLKGKRGEGGGRTEDVDGGLRVDVAEGEALVVLVDDVSLDLLADDLT